MRWRAFRNSGGKRGALLVSAAMVFSLNSGFFPNTKLQVALGWWFGDLIPGSSCGG